MPVTPTALGPYRIERELARGGMGVVYLAHDARLDRRVAIKALPPDVASDPERMSRFEREARLLASLNHPNLASVYDVLDIDGRRYLAMEYIEGESLADRLARDGALSVAETVEIGHQIASGMEAAHEQGVVHRDLKPANVMVTPGERVKIVDFGLAKGRVAGDEPSRGHAVSPVLASSPTMSTPDTMPGVILGTAPYLSPEQARGKVVDRRTDIWSFGCILYECLAGQRLFRGETVSDTVAAILERPIDWGALPKKTPSGLRSLLARCLERDPRRRLRDIGEARVTLEAAAPAHGPNAEARTAGPVRTTPVPLWRRVAPVLGILGGLVLGWHLFGDSITRAIRGAPPPMTRLSLIFPPDLQVAYWNLTPDASTLLIQARRRSTAGTQQDDFRIYRRRLDEEEFKPIEGTERVGGFGTTPDGKTILFLAHSAQGPERQLFRVPVDGASPATAIAPWSEERTPGIVLGPGKLFFTTDFMSKWGIYDVQGPAPTLVPFGFPDSKAWVLPGDLLPKERGLLLSVYPLGAQGRVGVLDLRSKKYHDLLPDADHPTYDPAGRLLFTRQGTLLAIPFDVERLEVRGDPVALEDRVASNDALPFAYSRNGTLAYQPGARAGSNRAIVAVDAAGNATDWTSTRKPFQRWPRLSPDRARVAVLARGSQVLSELWVVDRGQASTERLATPAKALPGIPIWSPDGSRIAFGVIAADVGSGVYVRAATGGGAALQLARAKQDNTVLATSWSPDGSAILATVGIETGDIGIIPGTLAAGARAEEPRPLITGPANESNAVFSPDGKWIAYQSDESGRNEIYLRPYLPDGTAGAPTLISQGDGSSPLWARDGAAVYYEADRRIMRVGATTRPALRFTPPAPAWDLNRLRIVSEGWDILPDGRLIGIQKDESEDELSRLDLVLHFDQELDRKVPRK